VNETTIPSISIEDVYAASQRIAPQIRRVVLAPMDIGAIGQPRVELACEFWQHTGSFKARGAANLATFHQRNGTMPDAGIVIASGGNAGLACAWAARTTGTPATVFVPETVPRVKLSRLEAYGAKVQLTGSEYADALAGSIIYAQQTGALLSHAYDHPLIAAGAGTLALEMLEQDKEINTIVVAVGGGGLLAGTIAAVAGMGVKVVAVEPVHCCALNSALQSGRPIDVRVDSIAADSLGARRVSRLAFELARSHGVTSVLVADNEIARTRQALWDDCRIVVELGGATALAALASGAYRPRREERVAAVLCGANTDPSDLVPAK
jgi:threonine dehydratase